MNKTAAVGTRTGAEADAARTAAWVAVASIAASLALRALYLAQSWRIDWASFPMFLGDEGTHGLMAMHILEGERPMFYYGAFYHGSFDAYLTALLFRLFGVSLTVTRLTPLLFSFVLIAAAYAAGRRLYGRGEGLLAAALVALPSKFVFEWGTLSLCGYCGYAAMVIVVLYLAASMMETVTRRRVVLFGLVAGVSIWSNQLSLAYVGVGVAALWLWAPLERRDWVVLAVAGLIGMSPLIYGNIQTPFSTFRQLGRKALFAWTLAKQDKAKQAAAADDDGDDEDLREYRSQPLLEVLGAQPGRNGKTSAAGAVAAVLLALGGVAAAVRCARARRRDALDFRRHALLLGLAGVGIAIGVGGLSGQPVGRYQLPLYPLLAVATAGWLFSWTPRWAAAVVGLVALIHAVEITRPAETDETTPAQSVVEALLAKQLHAGISAGGMYEIVFRSGEQIALVPLDHSRYRPYEARLAQAKDVFYIYRSYQERKPAHRTLMRHLEATGVKYERLDLGEFHVLYAFQPSEAVSFATVGHVRDEFRKEKFGE